MSKKGTTYLIPIPLSGDILVEETIPKQVFDVVQKTEVFMVENLKTARRYLRKIDASYPIDDKIFYVVNKRTPYSQVNTWVTQHQHQFIGVISEAGCPGIADPGELIVKIAHDLNMEVIPLVGPSSILMALIASGKNGQTFTFNGYLPKERGERIKKIKLLEKQAQQNITQIFMETPFRNNHLLEDILQHLNPQTQLCIASNITAPNQFIKTQSIAYWKKNTPDLHKKPTIFVI